MSAPMTLAPHPDDLARLVSGTHYDPHSILGAHEYGKQTVIRALRPHASTVTALVGGERHPMEHVGSGLFAVALPFTDSELPSPATVEFVVIVVPLSVVSPANVTALS